MRKILYSPGYGAGWTSWHCGSVEEKRFMLEHPGLIDAVLQGESTKQGSTALRKFVEDFRREFPGSIEPYLGGAGDLEVCFVNGRVRINEYDGSESVEEENEYEGWL